jgi:FG-GAP repeat
MYNHIKRTTRTLAVAAAILSLLSYLLPPTQNGSFSASANAVAGKRAISLPGLQGDQAVQQLKQDGLYDSLREAAAAARYELRWEDQPSLGGLPPAYRAPNPAQRLDAYFTPGELHLAPLKMSRESEADAQTSESSRWRSGMKLVGYGYGERLSQVEAFALLAAQKNRLEYRRPGLPLTEWYVNQAEGLEQGFTIDAPLGVRSEGERLRLALELTGDLRAETAEEGRAIDLKLENGEVALSYGGLYAYDSKGQALPSQMQLSKGRVILEVDDEKAVYPVTIDPIFTQRQKLIANDGMAEDMFGGSVAISGDTAVVGAYGDNGNLGSAYVFVRSGSSWSLQQKLTANDPAPFDLFGVSVAISGDTIVVGATQLDLYNLGQGKAYVFVRSGATWNQKQKLTASDGAVGDRFGQAVAISGDTIVVGASHDNGFLTTDQGSAYVFVRSGSYWSYWIEQQKLTASDGTAYDFFGWSVAISVDTVVIGAWQDDISSKNDQGSAYVFVRSGSSWSQQHQLTAWDGLADDRFGFSVAISGDTVVVGAYFDDIYRDSCSCNQHNRGSAYVFVRSGGSWSLPHKLTASDGAADDVFGWSVAISGNTIVVGARTDSIGGNTYQGSAYIFVRSGSSWDQHQKLTASDGAAFDTFGDSVAISGNNVVVGARGDNNNRGSAYVFEWVTIFCCLP